MRWFKATRTATALLSRMYLGVIIGLAAWALIPLTIGWTPTVVMSGSMLPNIHIGDVLIAQKVTPEQKESITAGQVLLAIDPSHDKQLVTHRVVNVIEGSGFITKGDANPKADPTLVPMVNVQGIERLRIPMIGIPIQALRMGDPIPMALFMIVTSLAQLVVMSERNAQKEILRLKKGFYKRGRRRATSAKNGKSVQRVMTSVSVYSMVTVLSVAAASSAATFSGLNGNNGNEFAASANFTSISYQRLVLADNPFSYYRLNDTSAKSDTEDLVGGGKKTKYSTSGIIYGVPGALSNDSTNKAITLDGVSGNITNTGNTSGPRNVTLEIWFKTTSTKGGMLVGFEEGGNVGADRILYMTSTGKVTFGVDRVTKKTVQSNNSYNDGKWHMATATLSGLDAALYLDGRLVSSGSTTNAPTTASGDWFIGGGNFTGWSNQPSSNFFAGSVDEVSIYTKELTPSQILAHYKAS